MSNLHLKSSPTFKDLQDYVEEMEHERGFIDQSSLQTFLLLTEEIGELAKIVRKSHAGMRTDSSRDYDDDAASEIADVFLVATAVANRLGVNIEKAIRTKEEKNKLRRWA